MTQDFHGAKLALLVGDHVVTLLRDNSPDIPWPDHWDLPGGAREPEETPEQTVLRELHEELGLVFPPDRLRYRRFFTQPAPVWFLAASWPEFDPADVVFGNEGQGWCLMPTAVFIDHPKAVPHLQDRLAAYLHVAPEA